MVEIDEINNTMYTSENARSKEIIIDCVSRDEEPPHDLIRFIIPYEIPLGPDGPRVELQFDEAQIEDNNNREDIDEDEIPESVKENANDIRSEIGNW